MEAGPLEDGDRIIVVSPRDVDALVMAILAVKAEIEADSANQ
jgi:hypothetical protein